MKKDEEIILKIITLGDSGVGKTSIIRRYVYDAFDLNTMTTLGLNFAFKDITLKNGTKIKLKFIDTAGQEKFRSLSKNYIKNAEGVIFVFSFDSKEVNSFDHITEWVKLFDDAHNELENIPKYLVGNKNDCEEKGDIGENEINNLAEKMGGKFISVSAKENNNISLLFEELAEMMFKYVKLNKKQNTKKLGKYKKQKKSKCELCNEYEEESI